MVRLTRLTPVLALMGLSSLGPFARADGPREDPLAEKARTVFKSYCYRCHGQDGRNEGGLNVVTDLEKLVESKRVIPGDPERSKLLRRIVSGDMPPEVDFEDQAANPPALPRPSAQEIATIREWIAAGAHPLAASIPERAFITDREVLKTIRDDLQATNARQRKFIRYFTLAHLRNAGYNEDQLQTYRHGLSKLLNSLSWNRTIKLPAPVDAARVILRIDLRDYLWDDAIWQSIRSAYPYGLHYEGTLAAPIYEWTDCALPWVRADWFVFAASRPPLYHEVLRLPDTAEALERKIDVDVAANIRQDRVARAGFTASGVSRNNRLIERHESTHGG
jgi:hypothetical protein